MKIIPKINKEDLYKGCILAPYIIKNVKYGNKWKNLFLKIKHFFIVPKYLKNINNRYNNKPVNPSFYGSINISTYENEKNNN